MVHHGFGGGTTHGSNGCTPAQNRKIMRQISKVDDVNNVHFVKRDKDGGGKAYDIIFQFDSHPAKRPLKDIVADIEKASVIETPEGKKFRIHDIDTYIIQSRYGP